MAKLHQDLDRLCPLAGIVEIIGPGDGVIERVVGIRAGQHLLHLEHGAGAVSDDRLGPILDGLVFFSPVLLLGVPHAHVFEPQWREIEGLYVDSSRRMTAVTPLFYWLDSGNRAGHQLPEAARAQGNDPLAPQ